MPDNWDILLQEIRALVSRTVTDSEMRVSVSKQGRYSWDVRGARVEGTVTGARTRGQRNPFFIAKTVAEAETKLKEKLLPALIALRERSKQIEDSRREAQQARKEEMENIFAKLAAAGYAPQMPISAYPTLTVRLSVGNVTISNWKGSGLLVTFEADSAMHNATGALALLKLLAGNK